MTRFLSSLTNRIFLSSALLAVLALGAAIMVVSFMVTAQAERDLQRGLAEAAALVEQHRSSILNSLALQARLVADLPTLKAAVDTDHAPTVAPIAADYRRQLAADLVVVLNARGRMLAAEGHLPADLLQHLVEADSGRTSAILWPQPDAVLQVIVVPIRIDPSAPGVLGRLGVGAVLDAAVAQRIKALTHADIAFCANGSVRASTLPAVAAETVATLLREQRPATIRVGEEEYVALVRGLESAAPSSASVVILRSRTEQLRFLNRLNAALGAAGAIVILLATLLSYAVARTITGPLETMTAAVREMAKTGDLTRRVELPPGAHLDEDARLLASTLNTMTTSIARFQREAAQRERLSSLGRLSTVIAHEIRNPLMIIKTALRTLRREEVTTDGALTAVRDIDEEVDRLNRLVNEVLDFARPVRFEPAPASLSAICRGAASAAFVDADPIDCRLALDPQADDVVTDAERLRQAIVNLLSNARQAVLTREPVPAPAGPQDAGNVLRLSHAAAMNTPEPRVELATCAVDGDRVRIVVRDTGVGIAAEQLPRIFEPYFTTRRTGSGLGLAITRNLVEGLGGTIGVDSVPGSGTEIRIDLPRHARSDGRSGTRK